MSAPTLPPDGSIIEMIADGETLPEVRVVRSAGAVVTLSLATDQVPPENSDVQLYWPAARRGRVAREGHVRAVDGNRVEIYFTSQPKILQNRLYVRGGGGETLVMRRPGEQDATGVVRDLSERSVRGHFTGIEVALGTVMELSIDIDNEVITLPAQALKVNSITQELPARGGVRVELVAEFDGDDEAQARSIRQYIMRHQALARQRGL